MTGDQRYVVVRLDQDLFGFRIGSVDRILPGRPCRTGDRSMLGLATVQGEPVPTVDLRVRLDYEATVRPGSWIVLSAEGRRAAFKVDAVDGILTFSDLDIESTANPNPVVGGVARNGHDKVTILEVERLVA